MKSHSNKIILKLSLNYSYDDILYFNFKERFSYNFFLFNALILNWSKLIGYLIKYQVQTKTDNTKK